MKMRLLVTLLLCALPLAGCYRQSEESFDQVDSAAVAVEIRPTIMQDAVSTGGDAAAEAPPQSGEVPGYITPETAPGQIQQPTDLAPTSGAIIAVTAPPGAAIIAEPALGAPAEPAELDPESPCVHTVRAGDSIFRLSLVWDTTIDAVAELNELDDVDELSVEQLLQIPGCVFSTPTPPPTPLPTMAPTITPIPPPLLPEDGPRIHVVSSGETLERISLQYRVDVNAIIDLNGLSNPDQLRIGQELKLPD